MTKESFNEKKRLFAAVWNWKLGRDWWNEAYCYIDMKPILGGKIRIGLKFLKCQYRENMIDGLNK